MANIPVLTIAALCMYSVCEALGLQGASFCRILQHKQKSLVNLTLQLCLNKEHSPSLIRSMTNRNNNAENFMADAFELWFASA
jgi:hypothetical protein